MLGPIVVIIGVEFEVELVREVSSGEAIVSLSGRWEARRCVSEPGDCSNCPCSNSRMCFSYDSRGTTKAGSGGMMNVAAWGTGSKSIMSLWLLYPPSLARRICLLRLTKKMMNPIVQASRTQAPETDPAMIGVLAFFLNHNRREQIPAGVSALE